MAGSMTLEAIVGAVARVHRDRVPSTPSLRPREVRRLHCAGAARPRTPRQAAGASRLNLRAGALPLDPKGKPARAHRLTRMPLVCSGLHTDNGGMIRSHFSCTGSLCRRGLGGTGVGSLNRGRGGDAPRRIYLNDRCRWAGSRGRRAPQARARTAKHPAALPGRAGQSNNR